MTRPRAARGTATLVAAALLAGAGACASTQYTPKPYPYVKMVQRAGTPQLVAGAGEPRAAGPLGGDLSELVADVPLAKDHAEAGEEEAVISLVLAIGGAVVLPVGTTLVLIDSVDNPDGLSPTGALGIGLTAAGAALLVAGLSTALSSQAHYYDAINLYNDAMWERSHVMLRGQGLPELAPEPEPAPPAPGPADPAPAAPTPSDPAMAPPPRDGSTGPY
ncbi:MAG: hypothetical protein KC635_03915 [Myxococcales bacterium]|nr:hypothetical protein [Myxococcales bacterium]